VDADLSSDVRGVVRKNEKNVLIIEEIHVTYHLDANPDHREVIERVHDMHAEHCPVSESISPCIEIRTSLDLN